MSKVIILIGMRGSGKTTVSNILARKLNIQVIDTDSQIEKQEKKLIKDIANEKGWEYFRTLETKFLKNLKTEKDFVLSTGGGIILREENRKILNKLGKIFYLYTLPETSYNRIGYDTNRPILTATNQMLDDLKNLYEQRKEIYKNISDFTINTELLEAEQVAKQIFKLIIEP